MEEGNSPIEEFTEDPNYQVEIQVLGDPFALGLEQSEMSTFHDLEPLLAIPSTSTTLPTLVFTEAMLSPEMMHPQHNPNVNLPAPYLEILQQPQQEFRFRYESELTGTHGRLHGDSETNRRSCYPTVELKGYEGHAIIRCLLAQNDSSDEIRPHAHCLVHKSNGESTDDPHYKEVPGPKNYVTKWDGMGIVQTSQKHLVEKLVKKKTMLMKEKIAGDEGAIRDLKRHEKFEIEKEAQAEAKRINKHVVYLRFDAFKVINNIYFPLCPPVYSRSISNLKSAATNKLKITRMSSCSSPLSGGEDVFLLVEKLMKDDVKVRFFERNEDDIVIWSDFAMITVVHYQTAIVIKTPPYKDQTADSQVKVFIELLRPSDGKTSGEKEFFYYPDPEVVRRKRPRVDLSAPSTSTLYAVEEQMSETFANENFEELIKLLVHVPPSLYNTLTDPNTTLPELQTPFKVDSITTANSVTENRNSSFITKTYLELIDLINSAPLISQLKLMIEQHIKTTLYLAIESYGDIQDATNYVDLVLLIVKALKLENELELNARESISHVAVKNRNYKLIERLRDFYSVQNCSGDTALHLAIILNDNLACSTILNDASADFINLINNDGYTAVQLAVVNNNLEALMLLWASKADILVIDKQNGNSLLHIAIENGCTEIVKYLMEIIPVISTLQNYNGLSCLALADSLDSKEIYTIIHGGMELLGVSEEIQPRIDLELLEITEETQESDLTNNTILNEDLFDYLYYIRIFTPECLNRLITVLSKDDKWKILVERLGFSYILDTDLFNGPGEFINYALEQDTSIYKIRMNLQAMGESECVKSIDDMFTKK